MTRPAATTIRRARQSLTNAATMTVSAGTAAGPNAWSRLT